MGDYITQADVEAVFGATNVAMWSQLDPSIDPATADTARIATGIALAEEYVAERFRGGGYAVPFSTVPVTLKDIIAKLAGVWLYTARGLRGDGTDDQVLFHKREANELIDLYVAGTRRMNMARNVTSSNAPFVAGGGRAITDTPSRSTYAAWNPAWDPFVFRGVAFG